MFVGQRGETASVDRDGQGCTILLLLSVVIVVVLCRLPRDSFGGFVDLGRNMC